MTKNKKTSFLQMEIFWNVNLWPKGQIVIPKSVREKIWIKPWDNLVILTKWNFAVWLIKANDIEHILEYMQNEVEMLKKITK